MDKTMGTPILQELHLKLLVVMVNRIEEATGFSAETTSSMIFLCSIGPIVGKHLAQAGVNWFLGPFLPWDVYMYPMGAQWRKHDDQVSCVES
jgi:hypothetical protein